MWVQLINWRGSQVIVKNKLSDRIEFMMKGYVSKKLKVLDREGKHGWT